MVYRGVWGLKLWKWMKVFCGSGGGWGVFFVFLFCLIVWFQIFHFQIFACSATLTQPGWMIVMRNQDSPIQLQSTLVSGYQRSRSEEGLCCNWVYGGEGQSWIRWWWPTVLRTSSQQPLPGNPTILHHFRALTSNLFLRPGARRTPFASRWRSWWWMQVVMASKSLLSWRSDWSYGQSMASFFQHPSEVVSSVFW